METKEGGNRKGQVDTILCSGGVLLMASYSTLRNHALTVFSSPYKAGAGQTMNKENCLFLHVFWFLLACC